MGNLGEYFDFAQTLSSFKEEFFAGGLFGFLPSQIIAMLGGIFAFVFLYKLLGREG